MKRKGGGAGGVGGGHTHKLKHEGVFFVEGGGGHVYNPEIDLSQPANLFLQLHLSPTYTRLQKKNKKLIHE